MILFLAENRFIIPVVCVLLLASYHNYRKDKEFLHTLTSHLPVFLIKEYTLITLPFAGMEMIKGRFTEAIGLWLFATLLPFLKEIKLEHKPIRLPFSTKEVMNIYGCSANLSGYMPYSCFFHSRNRTRKYKIDKVCVVLWGLIQASGYLQPMDTGYLLHFKISRLYAVSNRKVSHGMFSSPPFLSA